MGKKKQKKAPQMHPFPGFIDDSTQLKSIVIGLVLTIFTVVALFMIGMFASELISETLIDFVRILCIVDTLILITLAIINYFGAKRFSKKQNAKTVEIHNKELNERQINASEHLTNTVRKIEKLRVIITLYIISLYVLATFLTLGLGVINFPYLLVLPAFLFCRLFCRISYGKKPDAFEDYSSPRKFAIIHNLAEKAMKASGLDGKIRVIFWGNGNVGIARINKTYSLQVGVNLLDILTEDELYQIFLHEFAHLTKSCYPTEAGFRLNTSFMLWGGKYMNFYKVIGLFIYLPGAIFVYEFSLFRMVASKEIESIADAAILKLGNPEIAASALKKVNYISHFFEEMNMHMKEPLYATESPREDFSTIICETFRNVFPHRREVWDYYASIEIQSRNASHPIIRDRLKIIGMEYSPIMQLPEQTGTAFREEIARAIEESNRGFSNHIKENYSDIRKEHYLDHIALVSEWEQNGKPIFCAEDRAVIEALDALFRPKDAEEHCDRVINESESIYCTAFARYRKGLFLTERDDVAAIKLLYESIDININYTMPALDVIGMLSCRLGLQSELEEYRSRSVELIQKLQDELPELNMLNPNDNMSEDNDLPDSEKKAILDYFIKISDNKLKRIYLIRKKISETLSTSAYVLEFKPDVEEKHRYPIMRKAFNLLDNRPLKWQFSLFPLEAVAAAIKKMSHTCIYTFDD